MSKRMFRNRPYSTPHYPTVEQFDEHRRTFLGQLGATLLGALVLGELPDVSPEPAANSRRKPPREPKGKGKKKGGKKKKKKHAQKKRPRLRPPNVTLGLSTGNSARIDED